MRSISPSNVSSGGPDLTITLFGQGFVAKTVVQWNGKNLATTVVTDANNNILNLTAVVPVKLAPVIATLAPAAPPTGANPANRGATMKALTLVAEPKSVSTLIGPVLASAGTVAVILVAVLIV